MKNLLLVGIIFLTGKLAYAVLPGCNPSACCGSGSGRLPEMPVIVRVLIPLAVGGGVFFLRRRRKLKKK